MTIISQGQVNFDTHPSQASRSSNRSRTLPPADVLASILSEANGSAEILDQTLQTTPLLEFTKSELLPEFANRCQQLSGELQQYMNVPQLPDEDTMLTMVDTNDKLSAALSRYRRDLIAARKAVEDHDNQNGTHNLLDAEDHYGGGASISQPPVENASSPPIPPPRGLNYEEPQIDSQTSGFTTYQPPELQTNNPFLMAAMKKRMEASAAPTATGGLVTQPSSFYDMNPSFPPTTSGHVPPPPLDNPFEFESSAAGLPTAAQQPLVQQPTHPREWYEHDTADPFFNQSAPQQPPTTAVGWQYYTPSSVPYQPQYQPGLQGQPATTNAFNTYNSSGLDVANNQQHQHQQQQQPGQASWPQPQEPKQQGQNQGSLID